MRRLHHFHPAVPAALLSALVIACGGSDAPRDSDDTGAEGAASPCSEADVRDVVDRFGRALQQVSLLAPDSLLQASLEEHYGELVTPALLQAWTRDPSLAPGRLTSSPWPDRIEIETITPAADVCEVRGDIVYATSTDTASSEALREPVRLQVQHGEEWRISGYEPLDDGSAAADGRARDTNRDAAAGQQGDHTIRPTAAQAADVIRRYYEAIAAGEYAAAYRLWSGSGAASGQTLDAFARGFAETSSVQADVGTPTDLEGAAGSVYVKVPVVVRAVTASGERQHFEGTYTLRRSTVDGASAEQRAWRIYEAAISAAPADTGASDA